MLESTCIRSTSTYPVEHRTSSRALLQVYEICGTGYAGVNTVSAANRCIEHVRLQLHSAVQRSTHLSGSQRRLGACCQLQVHRYRDALISAARGESKC